MRYRIVAATKPWHQLDYIIESKSWWFPFWTQANNRSYRTVEGAKEEVLRLQTSIRVV